jgi:type III restriction enzyme
MKLKFKHQKFQAEAAKVVCDVFAGQPCLSETHYLIDKGDSKGQMELHEFTGFKNHKIIPELTDDFLLNNLHR